MPRYAAAFLIVTLSSIGLPGLNGFVGELMILAGGYKADIRAAAIAATGVILGAVYMLKLYCGVFFGPERKQAHELRDLTPIEWASLVPIVALIFILGVIPNLVLSKL